VISRVGEMTCPVLGLMAGDDPGIPAELVASFERALIEAGVDHDLVIYPGAPHSFFDRRHHEFAAESADAWSRVLEFVGRAGSVAG
jgi:carboxymethylenebutenolidase